jgi:hypothetical protein
MTSEDYAAIGELAKEILGENRVSFKVDEIQNLNGHNIPALLVDVHHPEVLIKNGSGNQHLIRDLYSRFIISGNISGSSVGVPLTIQFLGMRTTFTFKEWMSSYAHSHISGISPDFSPYCQGYSDFANIIVNQSMKPTEEGWYLLFLGVDRFVAWESLGGVPYRRMANMGQGVNTYDERNLLDLLKPFMHKIPHEAISFNDKRFTVLRDHPALYTVLNTYSPIKTLVSNREAIESEIEIFNSWKRGVSPFEFNGELIERKLILPENSEPSAQITTDTVAAYCSVLENYLNKHLNKTFYEHAKSKFKEEILRSPGAFQYADTRNHRKATATN